MKPHIDGLINDLMESLLSKSFVQDQTENQNINNGFHLPTINDTMKYKKWNSLL